MEPASKKPKKNSPNSGLPITQWPPEVFAIFSEKLKKNENRNDEPYYVKEDMPDFELGPDQLSAEQCWVPAKSNCMTVCYKGRQYQRPLHRIMKILELLEDGKTAIQDLPSSAEQCSHLCFDDVNVDGKGKKHCVNPTHMTIEYDKANKARQRCVGWVFQHKEPKGWTQRCQHEPKCLRFTPIDVVPT